MEKHKDYILRAKDYHKKTKALKTLKQKAAFRNPDEFYFGMIHSSTSKGVHIQKRLESFDHDVLMLLKTQDKGYIRYKKSINQKQLEKLNQGLDFDSKDNKASHTFFVDTRAQGIPLF